MPTNTLLNVPVPIDGQGPRHRRYQADVTYGYDSGNIVLPVAGPDGTAPRVIKVFAAIGSKTVDLDACKEGTPPILPQLGANTTEGDIFISGGMTLRPWLSDSQNAYNFSCKQTQTFCQPAAPAGYNPTDTFPTFNVPFVLPIIQIQALSQRGTTSLVSNNQNTVTQAQQIASPTWSWPFTNFIPAFFSDKLI